MTLSDYDECFELWNIKGDAVSRADSTNETVKLFWNSQGYAAREEVIFMDRKLEKQESK
jgi:hypothetical protein